MKLKIAAVLFGLIAIFSSCDDLSLINYDLNFVTGELTIDATTTSDTTYTLESGAIDPKSEMESYGFSADALKEATIKSVEVNLVSPQSGNFDWAKSAKVFITAEGQTEAEMASITDIPEGLTKFAVTSLDLDLLPYLKAGSFTLRLEASTDQEIPVDHTVTVKTVFNVGI